MWNSHRITFELLSPLHVGRRKIGNVIDTRPYVPGRAIWGALTARITRDEQGDNYEAVGKAVHEELAWTYFFPSTRSEDVSVWPWGNSRREFEWLYLGSYASTALEEGHTADEGTLHEIEYIAPRTRCGSQVYLVGYFFVRDGSALNWHGALAHMQLGGERAYGWGRTRLVGTSPAEGSCFGVCAINDVSGERPVLRLPRDHVLLAHACDPDTQRYDGVIEPLVGRETDTKTAGFGAHPSAAVVCWAPGTKTLREQDFRIGPYGIWHAA